MLCRCGKAAKECAHPDVANGTRIVLPPSSEPLAYNLTIALRLEDHAFDGDCTIDVDVRESGLRELTLHAKDLTFTSATFGAELSTDIKVDDEKTTVTFTFANALPKGTSKLNVIYSGVLNNQMCGFYRSTYKDVKGEDKLMASTQFEAIDARRCFPGWDEPARKSQFTCALRVPVHMSALSNMPESQSINHNDGTKTVSFMETPRMSTYLLAFVVGEFDHVSAMTKHGVVIRVYCPPGKPHLGTFALECAVAALDRYDDTFQIHYPLPKSDMVAIPEFAAGAMENWGLVTYREVDLLIDKDASSRQRQRVAEVVIHELAHQWFGNLVTMDWWDDLWLNEGFATWMETGICDELYPSWNMWEQFITDMQGRALQLDALRSSHPIQVPIANAEEVEQVFDAISYCKGGSVVRMVHAVVGKEKFVQGLRAYMDEFKYGNATTGDLWKAWELASGKPVTDMMGQWTTQMGFPLLEVVEAAAAAGGVTLKLKQSWFLADGSAPAPGEEKLWMIPVFATASGGAAGTEAALGTPDFMFAAQSEAQMTLRGDGAWVKLNLGQHVPLRVKYPDSMISPLCAAITAKAFPAADRIGLLSDQAALSRAGRLDPAKYLELLAAYQNEDDATVWSQLLEQLLSLHRLLQGSTELQAAFDSMARALLLPKLAELGWTPRAADAHLERKLRGELISALPAFGSSDAEVMAEARRRFDAFVADSGGDALPSEYQQAVYKLVLAAGGEAEFEQLLKLFDTLPLNDQKKAALAALGAAPTDALRVRALDFALSDAVKTQDFFYVSIGMHGASAEGMQFTWDFFQQNLQRYIDKCGPGAASLMDAVIAGACGGFATEAKAAEVKAFFEASPMPRNERTIAQKVESIGTSAKYLSAFTASGALEWLKDFESKSGFGGD